MFHFGQSLYRKWKELGLAALMVDADIGKSARDTFRRVLALPLIHPNQVRHAFSLIIDAAPANIQEFLMYFADVYIGFTEIELQIGADAFSPGVNIRQRRSTISLADSADHNYANASHPPLIFGCPSSHPSTPSMPTVTTERIVRRWEMNIAKDPQYEIVFWNVHERALSAIARTNNSMEASHQQFQRRLNHHPALSDFLLAFHSDIRKQTGNAANARIFPPKRRPKHIINEQEVMYILNDPDYDPEVDGDLLDLITLLGLKMDGYVSGFRDIIGNRNTPDRTLEDTLDEENNEEEDEGGEVNSSEENEDFSDYDDPWAASDCGQNPSASSDLH